LRSIPLLDIFDAPDAIRRLPGTHIDPNHPERPT
jgi:hypothetical protein